MIFPEIMLICLILYMRPDAHIQTWKVHYVHIQLVVSGTI